MRSKVDPTKKNKTRGLSMPPELTATAVRRAFQNNITFSRYIQALIRHDLKHDVLRKALKLAA